MSEPNGKYNPGEDEEFRKHRKMMDGFRRAHPEIDAGKRQEREPLGTMPVLLLPPLIQESGGSEHAMGIIEHLNLVPLKIKGPGASQPYWN